MIQDSGWETNDYEKLLFLLVGHTYGSEPKKHLDKIIETKYHQAQTIITDLALGQDDLVMDLGSGCGFISQHVAPLVKRLCCVDISDSFLTYARLAHRDHRNVEFHNIDLFQLAPVPRSTAIYSTAVFIHFNLYDVYLYLSACYDNLLPGGRLLFDFMNDQTLNIKDTRWLRHSEAYKNNNQKIFVNLQYHNEHVIKRLAHDIGYNLCWSRADGDKILLLLEKPCHMQP